MLKNLKKLSLPNSVFHDDVTNSTNDVNDINGTKFYVHSRKELPRDYCSINSLQRPPNDSKSDDLQSNSSLLSNKEEPSTTVSFTSNITPASSITPIVKEKRKAPHRPASKQLSYDEATIMKSVALRDKQPKRDEIEQELQFLEVRQRELEMEGVVMEKKLRQSMHGEPEEAYLLTWFELVNQKNMLLRRENELIYMCQEMDFLKSQRKAEFELRQLMMKPDKDRTMADKMKEEELIADILNFVTKRSVIVDRMDEDRLREYEEDQEINSMMEGQGLKSSSHDVSEAPSSKDKNKAKKDKKKKKEKENSLRRKSKTK